MITSGWAERARRLWHERSAEALLVLLMLGLAVSPALYLKRWLTFPFPLEYREAASVDVAQAIRAGINPYVLDSFPAHVYAYGGLYPLLLAPLMGRVAPSILAPRVVNLAFLAATTLLLMALINRRGASLIASLVGGLVFVGGMCLVLKINASRPDIPALFFMLLGMYVLVALGYSALGLTGFVACSFVAFFLKQYLILPLLFVPLYLFFFESKIKALMLALGAAALGALLCVTVRIAWPLYWEYALLHQINNATFIRAHMTEQVSYFLQWFWGAVLLYFYYLHRRYFQGLPGAWRALRVEIGSIREPLLRSAQVDVFDVAVLTAVALLVGLLGGHEGNDHVYFLELLLPFLLITVVPGVEAYLGGRWMRVAALVVLLTAMLPLAAQYQTDFTAYAENYRKLFKKLNLCQSIYAMPIAVDYLLERGATPVYDNGFSEYGWSVLSTGGNPLLGLVAGSYSSELAQRWMEWKQALDAKVKAGAFDCIVLDSGVGTVADTRVADYYRIWSNVGKVLRLEPTIWVPNSPK